MLHNLFQCPIELFEAYPIGRILNRLSCDMFVIGESDSMSLSWIFWKLLIKLYRPETSFLCAETSLGLPHLPLSYYRQLHSGLSCLLVSVCWWEILPVPALHTLHPPHHGALLVDTTLLQVDSNEQADFRGEMRWVQTKLLIFPFFQFSYKNQDLLCRCSSRELQRLESLSRAPVFSHFSDTLSGLLTIRSFRVQPKFISQLCQKIDENTSACLILQSGSRYNQNWDWEQSLMFDIFSHYLSISNITRFFLLK